LFQEIKGVKRLLLMRHAKSSWKNSEIPDHDRPLKKRGQRDAEKMGKMLKSKKLVPDLIISSTAVRAEKTAEIFAKACKYAGEIVFSDSLYMAEPADIVKVLKDHAKKQKTVMVIGHNPGLEAFLQIMTGKVESLPTSSIAYMATKIDSWEDISSEEDVKLKNLWRPKDEK
jgi:phosphohistidine phosphatase